MDVFIGLKGHANCESLPLRMGIQITEPQQQFATIESAEYDDVGTKGQRQKEIEDGNRHYRGTLVISRKSGTPGEPYRLECRIVLAEPRHPGERPAVITVLQSVFGKGDLTVTKHIKEMLLRNQITPEDLIQVFHPAYVKGEIKSSNDCEDIYRTRVLKSSVQQPTNDATAAAMLNDPEPVARAIAQATADSDDLKGPPRFKKLPIAGVKLEYLMVDAYIDDVRYEDDMIKMNCIDSQGEIKELHSFKLSPRPHLSALHKYAFEYLESRQQQRAMFAVCNSEKGKGFIAESVTAISLQLMKTKVGYDAVQSLVGDA